MKKYMGCMAVIFLTMIIGGCGNNNSSEPNQVNENSKEDAKMEPTILTYGYVDSYSFQDLDSSIEEQIVSFNKSQSKYYIETVKYGTDNYQEGVKALNTDLAVGKAPDIIEIPDDMLLRQLGNMGAIEDLYTYMDSGDGLKQEDFLVNILPWFETKGKLYGLTPLFKIRSMIGNPTYIQEEQITFKQFKELYESNKDNSDMIVYNRLSKNELLDECIQSSVGNFVDMEQFVCDFVNEEFEELLAFSAQFEDNTNIADYVEEAIQLQESKFILYDGGVMGGFGDYTHYRELTGENGILLGYPSVDGCEPTITTNFPFLAINEKSKQKEVAWDFISTFFEDQYLIDDKNEELRKGFPVTQSGFEGAAERIITKTKNLAGEGRLEGQNGNSVTYTRMPTTQADVDYLRTIISNSTAPLEEYSQVQGIIYEETLSYWSGSKTPQQIMEIIQNRVQLYLDEMR